MKLGTITVLHSKTADKFDVVAMQNPVNDNIWYVTLKEGLSMADAKTWASLIRELIDVKDINNYIKGFEIGKGT